jgi:hypothetical protein
LTVARRAASSASPIRSDTNRRSQTTVRSLSQHTSWLLIRATRTSADHAIDPGPRSDRRSLRGVAIMIHESPEVRRAILRRQRRQQCE